MDSTPDFTFRFTNTEPTPVKKQTPLILTGFYKDIELFILLI